jgi:nitrate reductase gamma subunit
MQLLDFARGPALNVALVIFVAGTLWRLIAVLALPWIRIASEPRAKAPGAAMAALEAIVSKMWPRQTFLWPSLFSTANGYVFHIGLAIAVFLFAPHILFFKSMTGLSWGALPNNVIYAVSVITAASLVAALVHRLMNPVRRLISRADDYISWAVTFAPVVTGLAAASHLGARYETLLAVHLLSISVLLIWFPFGRLMHAILFVFSRGATGVRFKHRGAEV